MTKANQLISEFWGPTERVDYMSWWLDVRCEQNLLRPFGEYVGLSLNPSKEEIQDNLCSDAHGSEGWASSSTDTGAAVSDAAEEDLEEEDEPATARTPITSVIAKADMPQPMLCDGEPKNSNEALGLDFEDWLEENNGYKTDSGSESDGMI
jgi:hypothetical protein